MSQENPVISVVITAFNLERFIEEAIDSVLNQTYKNFEIIAVDDGSTDRTAEIIRELSGKDSRIRFYFIPHSGKPAAVRNYGIKKAAGDYIAFLDGDDFWEGHKLEEQLNSFTKNPGVVLVYSASITVGTNIFSPHYEVLPLLYKTARNRNDLLRRGNSIPLSAVLVRKKYLDEVNGFDEDPDLKIEDFDLWLRLSELGPFIFLPRVHLYYRVHSNQFSADWETKKKRLEYLAKKKNLRLHTYKFMRNQNIIFRILRGLIHYLNYLIIIIITSFRRYLKKIE